MDGFSSRVEGQEEGQWLCVISCNSQEPLREEKGLVAALDPDFWKALIWGTNGPAGSQSNDWEWGE